MNFPLTLQSIFDAVATASEAQDIRAYAIGAIPIYAVTGKSYYLRDNYIRIILESEKFNVSKFYNSLNHNIVINEEVENIPEKYCVLSKPYILDFCIFKSSGVEKYVRFNTDSIYYDIIKKEVVDVHNIASKDFSILSLVNPDNWTTEDILGFIYRVGSFSVEVEKTQVSHLTKIILSELKEPISVTFADLLVEILLTYQPGSALLFAVNTFSDGKQWLFEKLLDVMSTFNIPVKEDVLPDTLFTEKNLALIDVYGEFFLSKQVDWEQPNEKKSRLNTILRLIFDSPDLKIETPYIDRVSVLTASMLGEIKKQADESIDGGVIRLFEDPVGCEYGECPPCDPLACDAQGKGPCCCCHSVDVISEAKFNCHSRVILSCNADGTSPGPGEDIFPIECPECYDACEVILGIGSHVGQDCDNLISEGTAAGWWTLPAMYQPCYCDCIIPSSPCQLTCVTCENLFCESVPNVTGHDCHYNITLTPSTGCCSIPAVVDWLFVIDWSSSMSDNIAEVRTQIGLLIDKLVDRGAQTRLGLVRFGHTGSPSGEQTPYIALNFTTNRSDFDAAMSVGVSGMYEPDMEACSVGATQLEWGTAAASFIMLIADEPSQPDPLNVTPQQVIDRCNFNNITVFVVDGGSKGVESPQRLQVANGTGGQRFSLDSSFSDLIDELEITVFPTTCQCVDFTPIPLVLDLPECRCPDPFDLDCLNNLPGYCYDIPIRRCFPDQNCQEEGFCDIEQPLNSCGNTILIEPEKVNMICCADVGFGCDCDVPSSDEQCCGPTCEGMEVCDINGNRLFSSLIEAQDFVWCECFTIAAFVDPATPNCEECCCPDVNAGIGDVHYPCDLLDPTVPEEKALLDEDPPRCCQCHSSHTSDCCGCCLHFADGSGNYDLVHCRPDIDDEVASIWETCGGTGITGDTGTTGPTGPPGGDAEDFTVCGDDKCIVGEPTGPLDEDRCGDAGNGCTSIRNPAVVILNNGIGLVAYESMLDVSSIKIQQFKTSARYKVLPNREFNFGRLQHQSKWVNNIAKLYYYDNLPQHIIGSEENIDPTDAETWGDMILFRTGPLQSQIFPLVPTTSGGSVFGSDSIGNYITFLLPEDVGLSLQFPSGDDVYNIKWHIIDKADGGLIGDASDESTEGKEFIISNNSVVNDALQLPQHIYNGEPAPVAYPSITTAKNYSNAIENSHFVYLTYQALEDNKWNVYLRQIRLSEYENEEQISDEILEGNLESIGGLDISQLIYRIICTSDKCSVSHDDFALSRTVVMEVLLEDGREVYNEGLSGEWGSLCTGHPSSSFPRNKVFVEFKHTIITDRCPDQFGFDSLFYDWQAGQEFGVPAEDLSAAALFSLLSLESDTAIGIGEYSPALQISDINIKASSVGVLWYDNINESVWSVISDSAFDVLSKYKGLDISEPILMTENEAGHCTHPVVKVNYNNDVFIVYETTAGDAGVPNIALTGTAFPSTVLPVGIIAAKQIDETLNYFLQASDFTYRENITSIDEGLNQFPDMFIDTNDVIHLTWQSNRNGRWEIYYANSEENILDSSDNFSQQRITNYTGRSLRPSIDGDQYGRVYIVWHDSRFGNWEIMMAYVLKRNIIPLYQQDPYYASIRNAANGYRHSTGTIPLILRNESDEVICMTDITVNFYEDRLLSNLQTEVKRSDYPFAFTIPGAANDSTTETFTDFDDWICQFFEDEYTQCDPYCYQFICTSPEFDTNITESIIDSITVVLSNLGFGETIDLAFRGSNNQDDPNSELQWTDYARINTGGVHTYATLGLSSVSGKYKQVRIRVTLDEPIEPSVISDDIPIADSEDDGFFHFNITVEPTWHQGGDPPSTPLIVRASTGTDGRNRIVLRFPIVCLGTTTVIDRAVIFLTALNTKSGMLPVNIGLLDIADAATLDWSVGADPDLLPEVVESQTWFMPSMGSSNAYSSNNIDLLVQSFVDRPDFVSGNYIGFELSWNGMSYTGDPDRVFYAAESAVTYYFMPHPALNMTYHDEPASVDDGYISSDDIPSTWNQGTNSLKLSGQINGPSGYSSTTHIYLRFPIKHTTASRVDNATLWLTPISTNYDLLTINIHVLDYDDASSLDWSAANFDVTDLPDRGTASTTHVIGTTTVDVPVPINVYDHVVEFMERLNFETGQYIGLEITVDSGTTDPTVVKEFYSNETGGNTKPRLALEYSQTPVQEVDDGNLTHSLGVPRHWTHSDTTLLCGFSETEYGRIFIRFPIYTEQGGTVDLAVLSFYDSVIPSGSASLCVRLLDFDDMLDQDWSIEGDAAQGGSYGTIFDPTDPPAREGTFNLIFVSALQPISADITTIVQAYVDRIGYVPGNYIGIELSGGGYPTAGYRYEKSRDSSESQYWPTITYTSSIETVANNDDGFLYNPLDPAWIQGEGSLRVSKDVHDQEIFLRFPIGLPSTASSFWSADLVLTSDTKTTGTLHVWIQLLDVDDISVQDWTAGNFPVRNIPGATSAIAWSIPPTEVGSTHRINIDSLVSAFLFRKNYVPGNYMGLRVYWSGSPASTANFKSFISAELGTDSEETVKPQVEINLVPYCSPADDAWIDDVIVTTSIWEQFYNSIVLSRDYDGNDELSNILLRFPVDITNLTDIHDAFLSLTPDITASGTFGAKIHLLDVGDASLISWDNSFDPDSRPARSGTYVGWEIGSTTANVTIISPSIKNLLDTFFSRQDYSAGNYMALEIAWDEIISSDSDTRSFYSKESSIVASGTAPMLQIMGITSLPVEVYWPLSSLSVTSISLFRLCLAPREEVSAQLDLTPITRIDQEGNVIGETPLPIELVKNRTYFIDVVITEEDSTTLTMPSQLRSISCFTCDSSTSTWEMESCSVKISIPNESNVTTFMNFQVTFYYDEDKTREIVTFNAFPGHPDLDYFTVEENDPAQNVWATTGLRIFQQQIAELLLWPNLSPTVGLLCGITYYVDIKYCQNDGLNAPTCGADDLVDFDFIKWKCNCESIRWEPIFEDAPENLRGIIKWRSSGSGFSDTRLTETIGVDNLNPVIRMRSYQQGVVFYITNRQEESVDTTDYKIFASIFNLAPTYNMYASGAEVSTSPFAQLIHRSDIPICKNDGECFDSNGDRIPDSTLIGTNPALAIDQFDNLFLAFEEYVKQPVKNDASDCREFFRNKQQIIKVHTCGLKSTDLFALPEPGEDSTVPCKPTDITSQSFLTSYEPVFSTIIRKIRVMNEFVKYHITRGGSVSPVIGQCDIKFEIIGGPEAVAVRLRNGRSDEWSAWTPFAPETGENAAEIEHTVTSGSGYKNVDFQVATYTGLMTTATALIIADYLKVSYSIKFYKPLSGSPPPDGTIIDRDLIKALSTTSGLWNESNRLNTTDSLPVAAIRSPVLVDGEIIVQTSDYIFLEIIPSTSYMEAFRDIPDTEKQAGSSGIEPSFDFIHQGGDDQFGLPTIWARVEGIELFRGVIEINKDNQATFKDGLASIIPHFQKDCSSDETLSASDAEYIRDPYNIVVSGVPASGSGQSDVWDGDRDTIGQIEYQVRIRPSSEDPYFVFGDPKYRLKKHDE